MNTPSEYIRRIRTIIAHSHRFTGLAVIQERVKDELGLYRYRLSLDDGGMLEIFERFYVKQGRVEVTKYSFHWQDREGALIARWDNAAHHPEVETHPHHVHRGSEENVLPYAPVSAEDVLKLIEQDEN